MKRLFVLAVLIFLLTGCTEFHWITPVAATPAPQILPMPDDDLIVPEEEVGEVMPDPTPVPPCEIVKGNISSDGRKLYHVEGMRNYHQVKIDEAKGESFFCSEQEALDAGWVRAGN